jgi:hypothetical protein
MDELEYIKKLAGVNEFKGYTAYEGSNISITGMEKKRLEKEMGLRPGDPEWFKLWFSLPYLNGPIQFRSRTK